MAHQQVVPPRHKPSGQHAAKRTARRRDKILLKEGLWWPGDDGTYKTYGADTTWAQQANLQLISHVLQPHKSFLALTTSRKTRHLTCNKNTWKTTLFSSADTTDNLLFIRRLNVFMTSLFILRINISTRPTEPSTRWFRLHARASRILPREAQQATPGERPNWS